MGSVVLVLGLLWPLLAPTTASAWLMKLERCEYPAARPGSASIVYPREGLPAVIAPGGVMNAIVVVPRALSPKPGVQQPWARKGWSAELIGIAHGVQGQVEFRYPLEVENIMPDAGDTFVYHARVPIPAYVAAGSYSLRMTVPHRRDALFTHGSIRVVRSPVRVASFTPPNDLQSPQRLLAQLAHAPVDVVLVQRGSALALAARSLDTASETPALLEVPLAAKVRIDGETRAVGECGDTQWGDQPPEGALRRDDGEQIGLPTEWPRVAEGAMHFASDGSEWRVFVPAGQAVREEGLTFYPAMPVPSRGFVRGAIANVSGAAATTLHFREPSPLSLELSSVRAIVGEPFELRAEASPGALIAWGTTSGDTHIGERAKGRLDKLGDHRVYATAIGRDGGLLERSALVRVDLRNHGCAVAAQSAGVDWRARGGQSGQAGLLPTFWAFGIVLLIYRRSARE